MLIGAHVPTLGSYEKMAEYAVSVGCECVQIFAKSPRQWAAKPMEPSVGDTIASVRAQTGLGPIFTHTAYLINLTTDKEELWDKSIVALADELVRGSTLGARGVNTHLGNVPNGDTDAAKDRAARGIERAFEIAAESVEVTTCLIVENTAGAGTTFGGRISDLVDVIVRCSVPNEKLGICVDTCHAWAYGYDVSTHEGWDEIVAEIDSTIGLDRWMFVHANDCKFERGSHKDRHEWIGEGFIGRDGFKYLLHIPELDHLCCCTEMPGEMPSKDIVNIEMLKALRS